MKLFTKAADSWIVNPSVVQEYLRENNIPDNLKLEKIKEFILEKLVYNRLIMKNLAKISEVQIPPDYNFLTELRKDGTLIDINITIEDILDYLERNKNNLKNWQSKIYERLKNNTLKENQYEIYANRKIVGNLTYLDLLNILRIPEDKLTEMIKSNNFKGVTGEEIYKAIHKYIYQGYILDKKLLKLFNITNEETDIIIRNAKKIDYHFKINKNANIRFVESKNIANQFELNDKIKKAVLKGMPLGFNNLQKAYYIYRRLCQLFSYDEDYYCYGFLKKENKNAKTTVIDHGDIKRLNNLDINSEVICTEITMLFAKFLEILGIPYQIVDYNDRTNIDYKTSHMRINFKVDDVIIQADAGHGLLGSDMAIEKTYGFVNHFHPLTDTPLRIVDKVNKQLKEVDKHIEKTKEQQKFSDAVEIYEQLYKKDNNISIEERVSIILDIINNCNLRYMDMINFITNLKKRMFSSNKDACYIEYVINKKPIKNDKTYEVIILIIYNENNDVNLLPEKNKYIIVNSDKNKEHLTFEQLKERFNNGTYALAGESRREKYRKWVDESENKVGNGFRV